MTQAAHVPCSIHFMLSLNPPGRRTLGGRQQLTQQPWGSSNSLSFTLKQQQQSTRLACVPEAASSQSLTNILNMQGSRRAFKARQGRKTVSWKV